jgi:hypothetical protein
MLLSPLEKFYEALSDEQRERINAMNGSTEGARSPSDMAALCSQEAGWGAGRNIANKARKALAGL